MTTAAATDDIGAAFGSSELEQLVRAAASHDRAEVARLVSTGIEISGQGEHGVTPAHWFVFKRDLEALRIALDAGANPNVQDENGWSAVHLAARADDPVFLKALAARGADLDALDGTSELSPLMIAISSGRIENARCLLDLGADIEAHAENGDSAATEAVVFGHFDVLEDILARGYSFDLPRLLSSVSVRRVPEEHESARQRVIATLEAAIDPGSHDAD